MRYRNLLVIFAVVALPAAGILVLSQMHNRQDLNAFMKERYGKFDPKNKYWVKDSEDLNYMVCASQDIEINGEPHSMIAVCGEVPDDLKSHAACGYVDLYVMKHSFTGMTPVAELLGIESGSFGIPGNVLVVRLGKQFYGFAEEGGYTGQGYTNGYMTIYVPVGRSFHKALRFSTAADDSGAYHEDDQENHTSLERNIEFIPRRGSNVYAARITSSGYYDGEKISTVHILTFNLKKHEYRLPKDFDADVGF